MSLETHLIRLTGPERWALVALVAGYLDTQLAPDEDEEQAIARMTDEQAEEIRMFTGVFRALCLDVGDDDDWRGRLRALRAHLRAESERMEREQQDAELERIGFRNASAH